MIHWALKQGQPFIASIILKSTLCDSHTLAEKLGERLLAILTELSGLRHIGSVRTFRSILIKKQTISNLTCKRHKF